MKHKLLIVALGIAISTLSARADYLVSSYATGNVLRYDNNGGYVGVFYNTGAGNNGPYNLNLGPNEDVFISMYSPGTVHRVDKTGALVTSYNTGSSFDVAFRGTNEMLSANYSSAVLRFTLSPFASLGSFGGGGTLVRSTSVAIGTGGDIFVADETGGNRVLRYNGTTLAEIGVFGDASPAAGPGQINQPTQVDFGPNGNLFVANFGKGYVSEYNGTTGAWVQNFDDASISSVYGFGFGPDGKLYASDFGNDRVVRFALNGTFEGTFISAGAGGLDAPIGVLYIPEPSAVALLAVSVCFLLRRQR